MAGFFIVMISRLSFDEHARERLLVRQTFLELQVRELAFEQRIVTDVVDEAASVFSRVPATNRLMPSGASRIVPRKPSALQRSVTCGRQRRCLRWSRNDTRRD